MRRQQGAALMLVVWLLVLLTALVGSFALSARVEVLLGRGLARRVVALEAARAGVEMAVLRLHHPDPAQRWRADGRTYAWTFGEAEISIQMVDEAGKVDLNTADAALLALLMRELRVPAARAQALAAAIVDWRDEDDLITPEGAERAQYLAAGLAYGPRNAEFETLAELQLVLGMDDAVYARLRPHLTLDSDRPLPDPHLAQPAVLAALGVDVRAALSLRERPLRLDEQIPWAGGRRTVAIAALARLADGREHRLYVLLRTGTAGAAYTVLEWSEGA